MEPVIWAGAFLLRENRVLLGKRTSAREVWPGVWDMIGGHCEEGESPVETLSRELREEIGVTPTRFARLITLRGTVPGADREYEFHVYLVTSWTGSPRNLQRDEHSEVAWFSIEEAGRLDLAHPAFRGLLRSLESMGNGG